MIGSIVVPQQIVEKLVALQGELLAVGEPEFCDDEDCKRPHEPYPKELFEAAWDPRRLHPPANTPRKWLRTHRIGPRIVPGAWVLLAPRSWVPTPQRGVYAVQTDSILGVYAVSVTAV